jgi:hypothetical protein
MIHFDVDVATPSRLVIDLQLFAVALMDQVSPQVGVTFPSSVRVSASSPKTNRWRRRHLQFVGQAVELALVDHHFPMKESSARARRR